MPQSTIYQNAAIAVSGQISDLSYPQTPCRPTFRVSPSASTPVVCGQFFWAAASGLTPNDTVEYQSQAWADGTGTGAPVGLAFFDPVYPLPVDSQGNATIPKGYPIAGYMAGSCYIKTALAATVGQKVFANLADGTVKFGAAGATITGAIETNWKVAKVFAGQSNTNGTESTLNYVEIVS